MRGQVFEPEGRSWNDVRTGVNIRQVTSHSSIHHHPFFYIPAYDDIMSHLCFVSHRSGGPQIIVEERDSGRLVQLTDLDGIAEWSVHPSRDGVYVYFTAGVQACRVEVESLKVEELANFGSAEMREAGMVAAAMGTTTLSADGRWWGIPVKSEGVSRFVVIDTHSGQSSVVLERDTIGHPEFHPDDSTILRYAGPYHSRIWVVNRDGSGNRLAYERDSARKEWVVHESWIPGTREIAFVDWPHGMRAVDIDTGALREITSVNAWHAVSDRSGSLVVSDTTYPDIGLQVFSVDGRLAPRTICYPEAWNLGAHWHTDHCPYDDGVTDVYAPQHTHPHPSFSPDGRFVVFTSDRTGHSQVYEAELPDELWALDAAR